MKNQRGEIVTILTFLSLGLMLTGIVMGKMAVQQATQTQSKAWSDRPGEKYNLEEIEVVKSQDPTTAPVINGEPEAKDTPVPDAATAVPDEKPPTNMDEFCKQNPSDPHCYTNPPPPTDGGTMQCNHCDGNQHCIYTAPPDGITCNGHGCMNDVECQPREPGVPGPCKVCTTTNKCWPPDGVDPNNCKGGCSDDSQCGGGNIPEATPDPKTDACLNCSHGEGCMPNKKWCGNDCAYHSGQDYICQQGLLLTPSPTPGKNDPCLNCSHGEGCLGKRWCGNDCQYYDTANYICEQGLLLTPSPIPAKNDPCLNCSHGEGCLGKRWCGNDCQYHDTANYLCQGSKNPYMTPSPAIPTTALTYKCCSDSSICVCNAYTKCPSNYPTDEGDSCTSTPVNGKLCCEYQDNSGICYCGVTSCAANYAPVYSCTIVPVFSPTPAAPTPKPKPCGKARSCNMKIVSSCSDQTFSDLCISDYNEFNDHSICCQPVAPTPTGTIAGTGCDQNDKPRLATNNSCLSCLWSGNKWVWTGIDKSFCTTKEPIPAPFCIKGTYEWNVYYEPVSCTYCPDGSYTSVVDPKSCAFIPFPPPQVEGKLPPVGPSLTSYSWGQVQALAVAGKVRADQISLWAYEAAEYYYPGIKHKFCDPGKGECDFKL